MSKKTIADTKKSGGEIIVQVKYNQLYLKEKLIKSIKSNKKFDIETTVEKNRDRIETRIIKSFDIREQLGTDNFKKRITNGQIWDHWNKHIKSVIYVERKTEVFDYTTKSWKASIENSLYAATYIDCAKQFADRIRKHWTIENSNNYVRDETLGEDRSRIRKTPEAFAILRSFALNIFRINKENNIKSAIYRNCCSLKRVFKYFGMFK